MEASVLLGSFMPKIVISDVAMPNMDGVALINFIKSNKLYASTKIIIISALDESDDRIQRISKLGVHAIESKPCKFKTLKKHILSATSK